MLFIMSAISMDNSSSKYLNLVFLLVLLFQICGCKSCIEVEKMGLLEIKAFLSLNIEDVDFLLPSWIDNSSSTSTSDCCGWERVICDHNTGRVKKLSLNDVRQQQNLLEVSDWSDYTNDKFWLLNVSLFLSFEELHELNLSANSFDGFIESGGFKGLSSLKKLETLDVSGNEFDRSVLKSLGELTSLRTLFIKSVGLNGSFPIQELASWRNLEVLDVSYNYLESFPLTEELPRMRNLKALDLSYNHLKSFQIMQGLCHLNKLKELDLHSNFLQGILPSNLNNFTSLRLLDLSHNLYENLPPSTLTNLTSLEYIDLSHNPLEGPFYFSSFANHSKLQVVILGSDSNKFEVETERPAGWMPRFQLTALALSNCKLTGDIPSFLQHQSRLIGIDLSHNILTARFPSWLIENMTRLQFLHLRNNSLMGQLLFPSRPNTHIASLDVSDNQLEGQLQENVAHMIPNIRILNLSKNGFEGILPSSIANITSLQVLDLSDNNFSGEVPWQLLSSNHLEILKLSDNKFHGEILSGDFNLTSLRFLYLDNNHFTGTFSNAITRSSWLCVLDVSNNFMSGEIPSWIGNMTNLCELVLGNNNFKGKLPLEISRLSWLYTLDVSRNALSGSLPPLNNLQNLDFLHLQGNMFTGLIPWINSSWLLTLDLRDNMLHGGIPISISRLPMLRILLLGGNSLSGDIPNHLCRLTNISLMDLSNNSFSGPIPRCFSYIKFGEIQVELFHEFLYFGSGHDSFPIYAGYLVKNSESQSVMYEEKDGVEFLTKNRQGSYRGGILDFLSGLDLSCNNLTGEIPHELGMLSSILALNLSHNQLKGSIPKSFSNLSQIESLDMSSNELNGEIPPELIALNYLEVFSVAHNNISGKVPDLKAQFGTFDESSYEDNPFLCGPILKKKCNTGIELPELPSHDQDSSQEGEEKWYDVDPMFFFASFIVSYIMILLGFITILYMNPYNCREKWFHFIEKCICLLFCT